MHFSTQCVPLRAHRAAAVLTLVLALTSVADAAIDAAVKQAGLKDQTTKEAGKDRAAKEKDDECVRRSTAVTLNYCRASFYRIQKCPSYRVLIEEQEKILNNLDLNGIADQDVVKLYTAVLVEISEVRLADRERHVIQEKFHSTLGTALTADAFDFGTELASAHYLAAVRSGVRSWWDYRNISTGRDTDAFHVDQKRLMAFTEKSAQFLNTFWKLAHDRKIPDSWLVRNHDLNRLDAAMQEPDLRVRLRVLKRMEAFMACYPPYWYYLARTQQGLGHLSAALCTYEKLALRGQGHFRKDEMLAAGLANEAMIQEYLHQPAAPSTALKALSHSTDAWEANLMCAHVLGRSGRFAEAEDAVLRNLDVGLEREQSALALVSLYTMKGSVAKLQAQLSQPETVRRMPMPSLIRAAAALGPQKLPSAVVAHWASSVSAHYELKFGPDEFVLDTAPLWNLQTSEMSLMVGNESSRQSTIALLGGKSQVRFGAIGELGHPFYTASTPPAAVLIVKYPGVPIVRLKFDCRSETPANPTASSSFPVVDMLTSASVSTRRQPLYLTSVEIGETVYPISSRPAVGIIPESDETEPPPSPIAGSKPTTSEQQGIGADSATGPTPSIAAGRELPRKRVAPEPPIPLLSIPKLPSLPPTDGPKLFP